MSNLICRTVLVNRAHTPEECLDATKRIRRTNLSIVKGMPKGEGEETKVFFFKLGYLVSDKELELEYELRGLKPADPYPLAAVNETDYVFADEHPNGTHWKDADDNWCFVAFSRWRDERFVNVDRVSDDWLAGWWFAGVRQ